MQSQLRQGSLRLGHWGESKVGSRWAMSCHQAGGGGAILMLYNYISSSVSLKFMQNSAGEQHHLATPNSAVKISLSRTVYTDAHLATHDFRKCTPFSPPIYLAAQSAMGTAACLGHVAAHSSYRLPRPGALNKLDYSCQTMLKPI